MFDCIRNIKMKGPHFYVKNSLVNFKQNQHMLQMDEDRLPWRCTKCVTSMPEEVL